MADMFDYLNWRGDLPFQAVPFTPVDALILSSLVYLDMDGIVPENTENPVTLETAAETFLALDDTASRVRVKNDKLLLQAVAASARFRNARLGFYRCRFVPEQETQFAAMAFSLDDGTVFLAFRGTDYSLVGWKEDLNMSFQSSIPAQREAAAYTEEFAAAHSVLMRLGGHSKGGNLAVYAAAKATGYTRLRILDVYNLDGPGFTEAMTEDSGYLDMIPKIHTYIPESSIVGILLEHREPFTVIKSRQLGALQHEPYSWDIMAGGFIQREEMSAASQVADKAITAWLQDMSREEREAVVEAIYQLITVNGATRVEDLLHPKNIYAFLKALKGNPKVKRLLATEFLDLLRTVKKTIEDEPQ